MIGRVFRFGLVCLASTFAVLGMLSKQFDFGALQATLGAQRWGWAIAFRGQLIVTLVSITNPPVVETETFELAPRIALISREQWRGCGIATDTAIWASEIFWHSTVSMTDIEDQRSLDAWCNVPELRTRAPIRVVHIGIPIWLVVVASLAWPGFVILRTRMQRAGRCRRGECLACGYDLQGNVSGQCPECGNRASHHHGEGTGNTTATSTRGP